MKKIICHKRQQNNIVVYSIQYICVLLRSYSCEDKFVQERGVARLWEIARFDSLLPRN